MRYSYVFLAIVFLGGCAWQEIKIEGPIPRNEVPETIKRFDAFGKFLEDEQMAGRRVSLSIARNKEWGFDFLIDTPHIYENFSDSAEEAQSIHTGKYSEGYAAFRDWWLNLDTPAELQIGGHTLAMKDYEHLRYYEAELNYAVTYGHPLHEEAVRPVERITRVADKLKLVAFVVGGEIYILDARRLHQTENSVKTKYEAFGGRVGRYFVDIINAVLGNGPANMAPTPAIR